MSSRYVALVMAFSFAFVWIGRYLEIGGDSALAVGGTDEESNYETKYSNWLVNEGALTTAATHLTQLINQLNSAQEQEVAARLPTQSAEWGRGGNQEGLIARDWTEYGGPHSGGDLNSYLTLYNLSKTVLFEQCCEAEGTGGPENLGNGENAESAWPWKENNGHIGELPDETGEPSIPTVEAIIGP